MADAAQSAAFESAMTLRTTRGDRDAAYRAAQEAVADGGEGMLSSVSWSNPGRTRSASPWRTGRRRSSPGGSVPSSLVRARTTETSSVASP